MRLKARGAGIGDSRRLSKTTGLGDRDINRMGYGAMQLAGPSVFGLPKDRQAAVAVLRASVESWVNHIDSSDFYGPHVTNRIIREAQHPYADNVTLVTKVGARRDGEGGWLPAFSRKALVQAIHDNLANLGLEQLDVVNFRAMFSAHGPEEGSISEPFSVLAELQREGLIRHLDVSNVTARQIEEARRIAPIVCVQNHYNLVHRNDDAIIDHLAKDGIAYVPFFRWAVLHRCSLRFCMKWQRRWRPRQCRWLSPGCCNALPISC